MSAEERFERFRAIWVSEAVKAIRDRKVHYVDPDEPRSTVCWCCNNARSESDIGLCIACRIELRARG